MNSYAEKAVHEATEAGLLPCEIDALLDGHPVTSLVPPRRNEAVDAYADRVTSELFVHYLVAGADRLAEASSRTMESRR